MLTVEFLFCLFQEQEKKRKQKEEAKKKLEVEKVSNNDFNFHEGFGARRALVVK